jgi:tripartite-type tricarboxylate transporter receptor subunit TctC
VDFPKKEVTIVVNMGPGGGRDILARGVGKTMSKYLRVPTVIMNLPGASGARGIISLYHSAPDGYTIGVGMATEIINEILEKQDYESKKFIYLGRVQSSPSYWFVRSDSPVRSPKDLKNLAKTVRQSTFSLTAPATVSGMVFADREKFPLAIVGGYQSAAASMLGLIRGEVEFSACAPSVAMEFKRAGQIRPIMALYSKRSPDFQDTGDPLR